MSFTGKSTYSADTSLPGTAEDVADIVNIVSPYETPLLDILEDPLRPATNTYHEWLEDHLLPNKDAINDSTFTDPAKDTEFVVDNGSRFQVGDQIQVESSKELMMVTNINSDTLTVVRGYGGTTAEDLKDNLVINILGNAALEGSGKPTVRFTNRTRKGNYTQIFTAAIKVSGSAMMARQMAVSDELDYQKQERLRELLRDLENTIINGGSPTSNPQGSDTVRRTLRGIFQSITTNQFQTGDAGFPSGTTLDEAKINYALRHIWENSSGNTNLIVVNEYQKRQINDFMSSNRKFGAEDQKYRDLMILYESDFGLCKVIVSRWMPQDAVLLLDSTRLSVTPLRGRSFHFKPLTSNGDYECGELIGEYTLEIRNEEAHGYIRGLATG